MKVYRVHVGYGKSFLVVAPSFCEAIQAFSKWEKSLSASGTSFYAVQSIEFVGEAKAVQAPEEETKL